MDDLPFIVVVSAPAILVGVLVGALAFAGVLSTLQAVVGIILSATLAGAVGGRYATPPEERIAAGGDEP